MVLDGKASAELCGSSSNVRWFADKVVLFFPMIKFVQLRWAKYAHAKGEEQTLIVVLPLVDGEIEDRDRRGRWYFWKFG